MAARPLDLEVLRRNRPEDTFQVIGDADDKAWLAGQLRGWLSSQKWDPALWREFELVARPAGEWKQLGKVRA